MMSAQGAPPWGFQQVVVVINSNRGTELMKYALVLFTGMGACVWLHFGHVWCRLKRWVGTRV
jgi:hypothetical protein